MREVVFREQEFHLFLIVWSNLLQPVVEQFFQEHFFVQPNGDGPEEGYQSLGCERVICLQQSFELQQRLVIEYDGIQFIDGQPSLVEAVLHRIRWEIGRVLVSRESLFLSGGNDLPADGQRRCGIMIESRDA